MTTLLVLKAAEDSAPYTHLLHPNTFGSAGVAGLHQAPPPLPTRNERGEDEAEGPPCCPRKRASSPQPSPPFDGGGGEDREFDAALGGATPKASLIPAQGQRPRLIEP
jgi:hypothetical protein